MITVADLPVRVRRLEEMTRALAKEVLRWKECDDPLLFMERKAYLDGMQNALAGLDDARVALAQAMQRLETSGEPRASAPGGKVRSLKPPSGG